MIITLIVYLNSKLNNLIVYLNSKLNNLIVIGYFKCIKYFL